MGVKHSVARMLAREPWCVEFWSAWTTMLWAGFSYAEVERLRDWPAMRVLLQLGDERFWHMLGFGLGLLQIVGLACGPRWLRWGAALALCWFWAVLTVGVWAAAPWSPVVPVHAGWCAVNVFSVLQRLRPGVVRVLRFA